MGTLWLAAPRCVCQLQLILLDLPEHLQFTLGRFGTQDWVHRLLATRVDTHVACRPFK